jgi:hypothetical protein
MVAGPGSIRDKVRFKAKRASCAECYGAWSQPSFSPERAELMLANKWGFRSEDKRSRAILVVADVSNAFVIACDQTLV